jgi:hypothetical protein
MSSPAVADTNNDGTISVRDLKDMFVKLGYTISRKIFRRLLRMVDKDHSGSLSFIQFLELVTLVSTALEREANNIPDETYDVDISQLTQEELQDLLVIFNGVGPSRLPLLSVFLMSFLRHRWRWDCLNDRTEGI